MHPADAVPRVRPDDRAPAEPGRTTVEIVVPVHNEACGLGLAIRRVHAYLTDQLPFPARITIAENGSTDATWMRARELKDEFPLGRAVQIGQPGRGGALRSAWSASDADVLAYMDVDLSTDLNALLPLIAPLVSGHSDVAIKVIATALADLRGIARLGTGLAEARSASRRWGMLRLRAGRPARTCLVIGSPANWPGSSQWA